jgi:O-acetyl-ADP-ribose deacetylase (regulator of RNase III)
VAEEHHASTIAFPCISTGVYGYDKNKAAQVALQTVRDYLHEKSKQGTEPVSAKSWFGYIVYKCM